jgi:hypothetical protein
MRMVKEALSKVAGLLKELRMRTNKFRFYKTLSQP